MTSALGSLLLLLVACASSADESEGSCVAGEQRACACPGGGPPGAQICAPSGDQFGPCFGCPGPLTDTDPDTATDTADPSTGSTTADPTTTDATTTSGGATTSTAATTDDTDDTDVSTTAAPFDPPIPAPDAYHIVQQVALDHPDWLKHSCVEDGGTNEFLFELTRRLREGDDRWGLNWKRGVVGDLSQDVVDYHYGEGEREGSTDVHIIDVITGHCGDDPKPGWIDVTQATLDADTVGKWTLAGQDL